MGNTSQKGHEVDDHGPTLVAHHVTSYASDSDTEGKVCFSCAELLFDPALNHLVAILAFDRHTQRQAHN